MFSTEQNLAIIPVGEFLDTYQHVEKYLAFCKECNNFSKKWSCPPLAIDPKTFLRKFKNIALIGVKVYYDEDFVDSLPNAEEAFYLSGRAMRRIRRQVSGQLLELEKQHPRSLSLGAGNCEWCCKCARELPEPQPCKKPDKMRFSMDAFGLDLTAISDELLNTKILWKGPKLLPEYHTLIFGFCFNDIPENVLTTALNDIVIEHFTVEDLMATRHRPVAK